MIFQKARAFLFFFKFAGKANIFHLCFLQKAIFLPLKVKISKKLKQYMQKFSQFYVAYRNIVQFDHNLWKLDYFEKSVLEFMAGQVLQFFCYNIFQQLRSLGQTYRSQLGQALDSLYLRSVPLS